LTTLAEEWRDAGIDFKAAPYEAGLVPNRRQPVQLPGYREGQFIIQDPAQALLARFADVPEKAIVYDACAAPGGKTLALGRCGARVVAGEISPLRARRLAENVARAGSGREQVVLADARHPPVRPIDVVLLDAPCLATGTFARHPDARWRVTPEALGHLESLQSELLDSTARVVAPGGLLIYATCSLEPEENHVQTERFLERHPEFQRDGGKLVPETLLSPAGDLMILPQLHGIDGAYAARLRRLT